MALFGSTLKGTARPDSDIDLLVEFEPGNEPGLLGLASMEAELASLKGWSARLSTGAIISRKIMRFRSNSTSREWDAVSPRAWMRFQTSN